MRRRLKRPSHLPSIATRIWWYHVSVRLNETSDGMKVADLEASWLTNNNEISKVIMILSCLLVT